VLERALADRGRWQQSCAAALVMSVNVSAQQFMAAGFADTVAAALDAGCTDPRLLTLEVTETIFLRDSERAQIVLTELKKLGVSLALDDFGTGYSSLSYLLEYSVDSVKSDRAFIAKLGHDEVSRTVMTAVIQLAHGLGMSVVAEGVESAAQHDELTRLSCDFCQGFHFARPMSAANFEALVQDVAGAAAPCLPLV